jgi:hypothetical protein
MNVWREALPWYGVTLLAWALGIWCHRQSPNEMIQRPPWQCAFTSLPASSQREFMALREMADEAEAFRAVDGTWPSVESLIGEGLLPTPEGWERRSEGSVTAYLQSPGPWLLLLIEPDAAAMREPAAPEDEEHHRWPDGGTLHLTVWRLLEGRTVPSGLPLFPAAAGYEQITTR